MKTQIFGDLAQCFSLPQQVCAMNMGGEVTVTEQEPVLIAIASQLLHRIVGIVANAPTVCFFNQSSERVGDDIDIGRDMQSVEVAVIAGIDYGGEPVLG